MTTWRSTPSSAMPAPSGVNGKTSRPAANARLWPPSSITRSSSRRYEAAILRRHPSQPHVALLAASAHDRLSASQQSSAERSDQQPWPADPAACRSPRPIAVQRPSPMSSCKGGRRCGRRTRCVGPSAPSVRLRLCSAVPCRPHRPSALRPAAELRGQASPRPPRPFPPSGPTPSPTSRWRG